MAPRILRKTLIFHCLILVTACGRIEEKAKDFSNQAKSKGKQLIDTAINKIFSEIQPVNFSIRSIVKDFQNDSSINEIKGIQVDNNFMYVYYFVYTAQKTRVLSGINKIVAQKVNDYSSDENCIVTTKDNFYKIIAPNEKNKWNSFFWHFEELNKYDLYTCTKAPLRHYIIFDKKTDTVYHRVEELAD